MSDPFQIQVIIDNILSNFHLFELYNIRFISNAFNDSDIFSKLTKRDKLEIQEFKRIKKTTNFTISTVDVTSYINKGYYNILKMEWIGYENIKISMCAIIEKIKRSYTRDLLLQQDGDLSFLQWFIKRFNVPNECILICFRNFHKFSFNIMKWSWNKYYKNSYFYKDKKEIFWDMSRQKNIEMLEWWVQEVNIKKEEVMILQYQHIIWLNIEVVKWLFSTFENLQLTILSHIDGIIWTSIDLEIIKFIFDRLEIPKERIVNSKYNVFYQCIRHGRLDIIDFLIERFTITPLEIISIYPDIFQQIYVLNEVETTKWFIFSFNFPREIIISKLSDLCFLSISDNIEYILDICSVTSEEIEPIYKGGIISDTARTVLINRYGFPPRPVNVLSTNKNSKRIKKKKYRRK